MSTTGKSPDTARRGGPRQQRLLPRALRGHMAAVVVLLAATALPWASASNDVHTLRTELAGARAELRAAGEVTGEDPPDAFGAASSSGLAAGGTSSDGRHMARAVKASARHAERRVRAAEDELGSLLAGSEERNSLVRLFVQIRSLVHPSRDPETAGRLRAPVQGVVTSGFGPRALPSWDEGGMHEGIDIFAPSGTPVRAAADGEVAFAAGRPESGLSVVVDHGFDREGRRLHTVYSHLSSITVLQGQQIETGEVLGAVGNTGTHTTGPHLHFEVRLEGEPVDPRAWL